MWNQKEKNTLNAGLLWLGFLRYYTEEFDFEHDIVCCRRTKKLTKFEKMWTKHVFAIEGKSLLLAILKKFSVHQFYFYNIIIICRVGEETFYRYSGHFECHCFK